MSKNSLLQKIEASYIFDIFRASKYYQIFIMNLIFVKLMHNDLGPYLFYNSTCDSDTKHDWSDVDELHKIIGVLFVIYNVECTELCMFFC